MADSAKEPIYSWTVKLTASTRDRGRKVDRGLVRFDVMARVVRRRGNFDATGNARDHPYCGAHSSLPVKSDPESAPGAQQTKIKKRGEALDYRLLSNFTERCP